MSRARIAANGVFIPNNMEAQAMRTLTAAVLSAALLAPGASAFAAPSGVEAAFGNTVVSTYPDGRTAMLWLKPNHTYDAVGRHRRPSTGTWSVKGDKVCLKQKTPRAAPFAYCTAFPGGGVGATWSGKAVTGERIKTRLVAGHVS
jgi:hypothetical protein